MSLLIKGSFIFMFIVITVYCIFLELKVNFSKGKTSKFLKCGPDGLRKSILEVLAVVGGLSSIYGITDQMVQIKIKDKEVAQKLADLQQQAKEAHNKLIDITTESTTLKARVVSSCDSLKNALATLKDCQAKIAASQSKILELANPKFSDKPIGQRVLNSSTSIKAEQRNIDNLSILEKKALKEIDTIQEELNNSIDIEDKSKFIGSYLSDYFTNLDLTGQIAVSVLVLNQALLSALSTIIFIFYGEILLKKYNVETR